MSGCFPETLTFLRQLPDTGTDPDQDIIEFIIRETEPGSDRSEPIAAFEFIAHEAEDVVDMAAFTTKETAGLFPDLHFLTFHHLSLL